MQKKYCTESKTESYQNYVEALLSTISLGDMIRLLNLATALCDAAPGYNELVEETMLLVEDVDEKLAAFRIGQNCPRCGEPLYLSDLSQYDSVCYECEENF